MDMVHINVVQFLILLFGSKLGFGWILGLPYWAIWRCSHVRL